LPPLGVVEAAENLFQGEGPLLPEGEVGADHVGQTGKLLVPLRVGLVLDDGAVQLCFLLLENCGLGLDELKGLKGEAGATAPICELLEVGRGGGGLGRWDFGGCPLYSLLDQTLLVLLYVRAVQELLHGFTSVDSVGWACTTQWSGRAWLDRGHWGQLSQEDLWDLMRIESMMPLLHLKRVWVRELLTLEEGLRVGISYTQQSLPEECKPFIEL